MTLEVRTSPKTTKKKPGRLATEKSALALNDDSSYLDQPQSTFVSSPIQQANRRRRNRTRDAAAEQAMHANGYADDGFVVSDDHDIDENSDDSDGFEPVRVAGRSKSAVKLPLGPPITTDESMSKLDGIHRMVVEDFVRVAKVEGEKVGQSVLRCAFNADQTSDP